MAEKLVFLRTPMADDESAILEAYARSVELHKHWASGPVDVKEYLTQQNRYFVCLPDSGAIVGTFRISGIIRGWFQSGFLGYEAFVPYAGNGYMSAGLQLVLEEAFSRLNLHRLEANIQPDNQASISLVSKAGFVKEGFSKQYLRVNGGKWMDHERWAMINPNWREEN